jgi:hypothetical protein
MPALKKNSKSESLEKIETLKKEKVKTTKAIKKEKT